MSQDQATPKIFYAKGSSNLIPRENLDPNFKNKTVKLLEITESISCFYGQEYVYAKSQHN